MMTEATQHYVRRCLRCEMRKPKFGEDFCQPCRDGLDRLRRQLKKEKETKVAITLTNTNPRARIDQMVHELAYERAKHSYLWQALANTAIDAKAEELAGLITGLIEEWLAGEIEAAAKADTRH